MIDPDLSGLAHPAAHLSTALQIERRWRAPVIAALLATIPAFYMELLQANPGPLPHALYALAGLVIGAALVHIAHSTGQAATHLRRNGLDLALAAGLLTAPFLPSSEMSVAALGLRSVVAVLTLVRMAWTLRPLLTPGGLPYLLLLALGVLAMCGLGFWWLEPRVRTFEEGLWLAFTTAATVGYGDLVPTTTASRIFSVFVVLLGFGVLSLVTAAIAATWVESQERRIEREILQDLHRQVRTLHEEMSALRNELRHGRDR